MAIRVKDAASAAKKFADRAAAAASDYADGVRGAGDDWQRNAAAAKDNYAAAVTEAIGRDAFARGIAAAGGAKFESKAASVGAQRFPQGVRAAQGDWQRETEPYLSTLASLTLPPRRPKGDPGNMARVEAVNMALRRRKVGG